MEPEEVDLETYWKNAQGVLSGKPHTENEAHVHKREIGYQHYRACVAGSTKRRQEISPRRKVQHVKNVRFVEEKGGQKRGKTWSTRPKKSPRRARGEPPKGRKSTTKRKGH